MGCYLSGTLIVLEAVLISDLGGNTHSRKWPALVDTGADRSVVPLVACQELGLRARAYGRPRGFNPQTERPLVPEYYVTVEVPCLGESLVLAYGVQRSSVIIGRDLLHGLGSVLLMDNKAMNWQIRRQDGWTRVLLRLLRLW